jgi:hypothetical protein
MIVKGSSDKAEFDRAVRAPAFARTIEGPFGPAHREAVPDEGQAASDCLLSHRFLTAPSQASQPDAEHFLTERDERREVLWSAIVAVNVRAVPDDGQSADRFHLAVNIEKDGRLRLIGVLKFSMRNGGLETIEL